MPFFQEMSTQLQTDIISFNYRGFGLSDGAAPHNEEILHIDILAITDFVKKIAKPDQELILFGKSFGGAASIFSAMNNPGLFKIIVLESTFTSIPDCIKSRTH